MPPFTRALAGPALLIALVLMYFTSTGAIDQPADVYHYVTNMVLNPSWFPPEIQDLTHTDWFALFLCFTITLLLPLAAEHRWFQALRT
jgi:hypothetical protein